MLDSFCIFTN